MPRDLIYLAIIAMLMTMLIMSNGRIAQQQIDQASGLRLCETSARILDGRIKDLTLQIELADDERIRVLGLQPRRVD